MALAQVTDPRNVALEIYFGCLLMGLIFQDRNSLRSGRLKMASILKSGRSGSRLLKINPVAVTVADRSVTATLKGSKMRERCSGRLRNAMSRASPTPRPSATHGLLRGVSCCDSRLLPRRPLPPSSSSGCQNHALEMTAVQ